MNCVIGHPRSGTKLLSTILNAGGADICRHEYLFALSSMCVPVASEYYAGRATEDEVWRLLRHYDFTPWPWVKIDSNWKLTWILPVFLKKFPEARVLHLARDPRTNVPSCQNLDFYGDLCDRPEFIRRRYWLQWMPEIRRPDWDQLTPFERNCAFWTETHRLALESLSTHPYTHRVRLEDLHERRTRSQLFDFFDIRQPTWRQSARSVRKIINGRDNIKATLGRYKSDTLPAFAAWPASKQKTLADLCGETAALVGYAL